MAHHNEDRYLTTGGRLGGRFGTTMDAGITSSLVFVQGRSRMEAGVRAIIIKHAIAGLDSRGFNGSSNIARWWIRDRYGSGASKAIRWNDRRSQGTKGLKNQSPLRPCGAHAQAALTTRPTTVAVRLCIKMRKIALVASSEDGRSPRRRGGSSTATTARWDGTGDDSRTEQFQGLKSSGGRQHLAQSKDDLKNELTPRRPPPSSTQLRVRYGTVSAFVDAQQQQHTPERLSRAREQRTSPSQLRRQDLTASSRSQPYDITSASPKSALRAGQDSIPSACVEATSFLVRLRRAGRARPRAAPTPSAQDRRQQSSSVGIFPFPSATDQIRRQLAVHTTRTAI
ncbi:hypothetical protein CF319_g6357 [Tilletia indica]|nr:hypothetical protein CF319_g6357 [Tilletia indica]